MVTIKELEDLIEKYKINKYDKTIAELKELSEFITNENDTAELYTELNELYNNIQDDIIEKKFNFESSEANCFLNIQAGAGGVESFDWANMLLRMYSRFCHIKEWRQELVSKTPGEEAGIKSCTIKIIGYRAYGYLQNETGVHRLVRMSPFNSAGKRMTSFASVWVYPEIQNNHNIIIEKKDIRIDTFKASGAGGQHVNTTDSAVRITHIPTGIVTTSQSSRSQHSNKEEALKMLQSQLKQIEILKSKQQTINQNQTDVAWGNQIRSYVLQPYTMVKDIRNNFKINNAAKILDGDLEELILSNL